MAKKKEEIKRFFKKLWYLLWKEDSFNGWLFSIIFLFLFIKFIFFPLLILATGTSLPLAIVESCSMYHKGNLLSDFNSWWDRNGAKYLSSNINKSDFSDFPMKNGFNKGDILFIVRANPEKLQEGDIIIFNAEQRNPVIHRIININEANGEKIFSTMGDNNPGQAPFEKQITEEQLVGKSAFKLAPYAGWIKLLFYDWMKPQGERGFCNEN